MNFANNIKAIRKENQLSQEQLAEKLGVSRQSVSKWESNQSYPEMDKILLICKLFDCDLDELMNDNIKETNETKQSKTRMNKAIEDFFDYITRFVDMFTAMTFKQKVKCLFEQIFIVGILSLVSLIIWTILASVLEGVFGLLNASWYSGIMSVFGSIFIIIAVVLSLTVLLHIFKIRYLDYYEIAKPEIRKNEKAIEENSEATTDDAADEVAEAQDDAPDEAKRRFLFSRKREKVIIRDPKDSSSKFLVSVMKTIVLFFKFILGFIGVFFALSFICLTAILVMSFLFIKTGLLFIGAFLSIAAILAINFVILRLIYNFLASKKSRKTVTALILIISLLTSGIGVGLSVIGVTEFNTVDTPITAKTEFTVSMRDTLYIHNGAVSIKYEESNSNDVRIVVTHSKDDSVELDNLGKAVFLYPQRNNNSFEMLRGIIKNINKKQIDSYYFDGPKIYDITVYSSKENIEKIKENADNYSSLEVEIQWLYNEINALQEEIMRLESELSYKDVEFQNTIASKEEIIRDLQDQLDRLLG